MRSLKLFAPLLTLLVFASTAHAQFPDYTENELVASAPLSWQLQYDPAGRMSIGNDDGNIFAFPHASEWASAIRFGGAQGLQGLLYDFTVSTEGAPRAFGLARRGCTINSAATLDQCMLARWEYDSPISLKAVIVEAGTGNVIRELIVSNVAAGQSFSIERQGNAVINFYRSSAVTHERKFLFSTASPFQFDGQPASVNIEARVAFEPSSESRKISGASEIYYCCP